MWRIWGLESWKRREEGRGMKNVCKEDWMQWRRNEEKTFPGVLHSFISRVIIMIINSDLPSGPRKEGGIGRLREGNTQSKHIASVPHGHTQSSHTHEHLSPHQVCVHTIVIYSKGVHSQHNCKEKEAKQKLLLEQCNNIVLRLWRRWRRSGSEWKR